MGRRSRLKKGEKITYAKLKRRVALADHVKARNFTHQEVDIIVDTFIGMMIESLVEFDEVHIPRFGIIYRQLHRKRRLLTPLTKEETWIPPHYEVLFRASRYLRQKLGFYKANDKDWIQKGKKKELGIEDDDSDKSGDVPTDL